MSQDINNNNLYQALVPVLDLKIEKWEKKYDVFYLTLSEEINHKIRKDTAVYIDVRLPKNVNIKV